MISIHTLPLLGDNPIVLIITSRYLCLVRAKWKPLRLSPLISLSRPHWTTLDHTGPHWTTPGHSPLIKSHQLPPQQRQTKNLSVPSPSLLVFRLPSERLISSILIGRAPTILRSHWSRASCTERSYYRRP